MRLPSVANSLRVSSTKAAAFCCIDAGVIHFGRVRAECGGQRARFSGVARGHRLDLLARIASSRAGYRLLSSHREMDLQLAAQLRQELAHSARIPGEAVSASSLGAAIRSRERSRSSVRRERLFSAATASSTSTLYV